jgi:Ca2+/Na+ antiporter
MNQLFVYALGFIICALVIIYSGTKLSKYGDLIAEKTGMGKAWFGLVLMASVTSLPELITGISSIVIVDEPDLAVGDILGSCVFNLLILSILDGSQNRQIIMLMFIIHQHEKSCEILQYFVMNKITGQRIINLLADFNFDYDLSIHELMRELNAR